MAKNGGKKETPKNIFKFAASLSFPLKLDTSQKIRGSQFYYQGNMISRISGHFYQFLEKYIDLCPWFLIRRFANLTKYRILRNIYFQRTKLRQPTGQRQLLENK